MRDMHNMHNIRLLIYDLNGFLLYKGLRLRKIIRILRGAGLYVPGLLSSRNDLFAYVCVKGRIPHMYILKKLFYALFTHQFI